MSTNLPGRRDKDGQSRQLQKHQEMVLSGTISLGRRCFCGRVLRSVHICWEDLDSTSSFSRHSDTSLGVLPEQEL